MKIAACVLTLAISLSLKAQQNVVYIPNDTASLDLRTFATAIVSGTNGNFEKAKTLLNWLSEHFNWLATDYQKRTVKEIIVRKGGNCFELASVYMALLKDLDISYRPIAEINIHVLSEDRQKGAEQKVKESGNRMSVFGRQHNDHRWVEIYDETTKEWMPADPTMGVIGLEEWLKARAWFGERHTINDDITKDMIVPFAIYVVNQNNKGAMEEARTGYYLVTKLNELYGGKLAKLPSWNNWVRGLKSLNVAAKNAFAGTENLHNYNDQIDALAKTYQSLKEEYKKAGN